MDKITLRLRVEFVDGTTEYFRQEWELKVKDPADFAGVLDYEQAKPIKKVVVIVSPS